jgi:WD40 repeat protein
VLAGHTRPVWSVAITPDGTRAISGGGDGTVRIWDLATGNEQATLTGHDTAVFSVAITPDGDRAVSGGADATVRVWELGLGSGAETARWTADYPVIGCAALSGRPLKIGVGQGQGRPCVLELRTGSRRSSSEFGAGGRHQMLLSRADGELS